MGTTSSRFTVAVHMLALLAIEKKEEPTTSEYLARSAGTNPVVVRRILAMLGKVDLISAQSGTRGGVKLSRSPEKISLIEVYQAVEKGEIFSFGTRESNPHCICGRSLEPVMQKAFHKAKTAMETALADINIAQIAQEVEEIDAKVHLPIN